MSDEDARAIRQVLEAFVAAWNRGDAEAFANLYTDPHVDVNHTPPVETRAATVAALRKRFASATGTLAVTSDEVVVSGDWAVQRGTITLTHDEGARHLRYIEVLRKDIDGSWRVHWGIDAVAAD
jgi:uncharacterized protein (TIGR02246 family)